MDRSSLIGIILIALIVSVWVFLQSTTTQKRDVTPEATKQKRELADSVKSVTKPEAPKPKFASAPSRRVRVRTDVSTVVLSSRGATITSLKLNNFKPWYREQDSSAVVDLVKPGAREFGFQFRSANGSKVTEADVDFVWDINLDEVLVSGEQKLTITGTAELESGGTIIRSYTFSGSTFAIETSIELRGLEESISRTNSFIDVGWFHGLRYQEQSTVDESNNAVALASYGGEIDELDATEYREQKPQSANGKIDWLATRSKYFAVALIPEEGFDGQAFYSGIRYGVPNEGYVEKYSIKYRLPYRGGQHKHTMTLFAGPMQYDTLAKYGLTEIVNFGFKWIVKPIGEYFMLPTMKFIHGFVPNWGIAIIIFGLFLKGLLYPLSITQLKSARKMQLVAPLMSEIREKYKDDMKTQQQETMKIYSEYGINPAGGCLPLLLQMPFLYAMYAVLNLNVELRQAAFLPFWITDLSVPDVILSLPFKLPLFGIDKFSGLALLMGSTLFIQQKQVVTDPRQKAMVYMMPVMLTLIFSTLPAGLNLYYFVFNIVGIGQQLWMSKFSKNQMTLADLKKAPKKESWLQKKMAEAQRVAESQGRQLPGQPRQNAKGKKGGKKR